MVWANLVPPKVEAFVWRAIHGRIPASKELIKRGNSSLIGKLCYMCDKEVEDTNHILCKCEFTWGVWQNWSRIWNLHLIIPNSVKEWLLIWVNSQYNQGLREVWHMVFFGIVWTVWLCRNDVVFNKKKFTVAQTFDIALTRIGHWIKNKWPEKIVSISEFVRNPNMALCLTRVAKSPRSIDWEAPTSGWAKFNTDAAVQGFARRAGIGGVLRDSSGRVLIKFSKNIGVSEPTRAEMQSILEAGKLFLASKWNGKLNLIIETDCQLAILWGRNPNAAPTNYQELALKCKRMCSSNRWELSHVYREKNVDAHRLAKEGLTRDSNLFWSVGAD